MKERLETISKLVPALTLLCYVCGFVVYNTHLGHYGIIDVEIFNLRYIVAGLHYLFFAFFLVAPVYLQPYYTKTKPSGLLFIFLTVGVAYVFYIVFFYPTNTTVLIVRSFGLLFLMTSLTYLCVESIREKGLHFTDAHLWVFSLGMGSLFIFGLTYKHIKKEVGGGQLYKKILILERPINGFISVDKNFKTDTLFVIHENEKEIFFYNADKVCGIKKELVVGEILIKN